jgi:hypothetical protein
MIREVKVELEAQFRIQNLDFRILIRTKYGVYHRNGNDL